MLRGFIAGRQARQEIAAALTQPIPVLAIRRAIFATLPLAARFAVLAAAPGERPFPRFISGELGERAGELVVHDDKLAAVLDGVPVAGRHARLRRCATELQRRLREFDGARRALGDCDPDPCADWYAPAWISACIFREDVYRGALGLPGLIGPAQAMYCSAWHEYAEAGEQHLRRVWEDGWRDLFGAPSPFAGWPG